METKNISRQEIIDDIEKLELGKLNPTYSDIGDVYFNPKLEHPYIIVKINGEEAWGLQLTSNEHFYSVLGELKNRFRKCFYTFLIVKKHPKDDYLYSAAKIESIKAKKTFQQFLKVNKLV